MTQIFTLLSEKRNDRTRGHEDDEPWSLNVYTLHPLWHRYLGAFANSLFPLFITRPYLGTTPSGIRTHARRCVAFFSDVAAGYKLSKISITKTPALSIKQFPFFAKLLEEVNVFFNEAYNSCIVNYYRNGKDSIGPHCDNPKANGLHGVLTISLGAERTYRTRPLNDPEAIFCDIRSKSGECILMKDAFQKYFTHEVPEELEQGDWRISFTFRRVLD